MTALWLSSGDPRLSSSRDPEVSRRSLEEAVIDPAQEADRARVLVEEREDSVVVTVEDDGDGFAPRMGGRGFGIVGMRERAELLGGRFEVRTALRGRGCRVRAELPVSRVGEA